MIKHLFYLLLSLALISCSGIVNEPVPVTDPADAFVGLYNYKDSYFMTWGGDSGYSSYEGKFVLTKVSSNQVKMTGGWSSLGQVSGNTVSFSDDMQSDTEGFMRYSFGVGTLNGKTLSFRYSGSGSLKYSGNGVTYPCEVSGTVVATKQEVD